MRVGVKGTFYKVTRADGYSFRRSTNAYGDFLEDANWFDMIDHDAVMTFTTADEKRYRRHPTLCCPGVIHASPTMDAAVDYGEMLRNLSSATMAMFEVRGAPVVRSRGHYRPKAGFHRLEVIRFVPRSEVRLYTSHYGVESLLERQPRTIKTRR